MRGDAGPDPAERAVAASAYILPALDGFKFGSFIYAMFPPVRALFVPSFTNCHEVPSRVCIYASLHFSDHKCSPLFVFDLGSERRID